MSSIDKPKGEKYWKITFYVAGKRYRRSLGVESKTHAQKIKHRVDYELAMGTLDPDYLFSSKAERSSLDNFLDKYLKYLDSRRNYSEGTTYTYKNSIRILKEMVSDTQITDITPRKVETFIIPELEKNYKPATVKHHLTNLRSIFSYAVKWDLLPKNPFASLVPKREKRLPVFYKEAEIQKIREYFYHPDRPSWQRVYFLTMLNTGNRRTEHLKLLWSENIFLDEGFIKFIGKGNKERLVPLNDEAVSLFRSAERRLGEDRVFWQCKSIYTVNSAWRSAKERLEMNYKLHTFRSNFASWFMMNGGNLYDLMNILGWEDFETAKIYLSFSKEHVAKNRNLVRFDL